MKVPVSATAAVLGILSAGALGAQSIGSTTADLRGHIEIKGERIEIQLHSKTQGTSRTQVPDAHGTFQFALIPPGLYELLIFSNSTLVLRTPELELHAGTSQEINLKVQPPTEGQVAVEAQLDSAEEDRTQAAWTVDTRMMSDLPMNRRDFADLSLLTPVAASGRGPINPGAPDSGLSFAGAGPRMNNFMVDGLDNNDLGNGNSRLLVSQEAIQEFQVIAGGYAAEYGRATGGVVNAVTRSGSNQAEGGIFYFFRPGSLDARQPSADTSSRFSMRQYGGSASGPILKDRLFYFVCAERLDRSDENVVTIDPSVAGTIRAAGFTLQTGSQGISEHASSALVKFDYLFSPENRLGFRILQSWRENDSQIPWGGLKARTTGASMGTRDQALTLTHQWLPSSSLIHESRLMYTTRASTLGAMDDNRSVEVDILGAASFGTQRLSPQSTDTTYVQWVDTTTWIKGDHTFKGGLDWLHTNNRGRVENNYTGYYVFSAVAPYSGILAFQAGIPAAFYQAFGDPSTTFSTDSQSLFFQDDWRPRPGLLLRLGVRYDRESLPTFEDTADYQALAAPSASPYSPLFQNQRNWTSSRWSPRCSFSWQAEPAWRLFGGFGTFSGQTNLAPVFGLRTTNGAQGYGILRTVLDADPSGPTEAWRQANHRYDSAPGDPKSLALPGSHQMPVSRQWNLGLEWKPRPTLALTLDLLHSEGSHLMNVRDVNAFVGGSRVNTAYSAVYRVDDSGASRYSAQTLGMDWRPSTMFRITASYCHSRAEDNYSDWTQAQPPQNTFDPGTEWGPSFQDQRHRFVLNTIFGTGSQSSVWFRDWTISLLGTLGSGRPYSVLTGSDDNRNGDLTSDRPASVGRNSENLPWSRRLDLRLMRGFQWTHIRAEAVLDIFNILNHANVTQVQNVLSSNTPSYGTPTAYDAMRQIQVGFRIKY